MAKFDAFGRKKKHFKVTYLLYNTHRINTHSTLIIRNLTRCHRQIHLGKEDVLQLRGKCLTRDSLFPFPSAKHAIILLANQIKEENQFQQWFLRLTVQIEKRQGKRLLDKMNTAVSSHLHWFRHNIDF